MWTITYWKEMVDRAIKSGAQAVLLGLGLGEGLNAFEMNWMLALGFALGGVALSVLTTLASAGLGQKGSASIYSASYHV